MVNNWQGNLRLCFAVCSECTYNRVLVQFGCVYSAAWNSYGCGQTPNCELTYNMMRSFVMCVTRLHSSQGWTLQMASCHGDKGRKILIQTWSLFLSIPDHERMLEIDSPSHLPCTIIGKLKLLVLTMECPFQYSAYTYRTMSRLVSTKMMNGLLSLTPKLSPT